MSKKWKELLYKEPLEPRQLTPEQAFEAGKKGDLTDYDAAARKAARIYFEAALENCMVGTVLGRIKLLNDRMHSDNWIYKPLKEDQRHQIWQDMFLDVLSFLDYVMEKEVPDKDKEIESIGLSMFQGGWAVQAAANALAEEGLIDEYGWPKTGHLVKEGTCPRCNIPIQKEWSKKK